MRKNADCGEMPPGLAGKISRKKKEGVAGFRIRDAFLCVFTRFFAYPVGAGSAAVNFGVYGKRAVRDARVRALDAC